MTTLERDPIQERKLATLNRHVSYLNSGPRAHRGPALAKNVPLDEAPEVAKAMQFFGLYVDGIYPGKGQTVTIGSKGYTHHDVAPENTDRSLQMASRDPAYHLHVARYRKALKARDL